MSESEDLIDTPTDAAGRRRLRRWFAIIVVAQLFLMVCFCLMAFLDNGVAERVEKAWPPFAVIFPSYVAFVMHYVHLGSRETIQEIAALAKVTPKPVVNPPVAAARSPRAIFQKPDGGE